VDCCEGLEERDLEGIYVCLTDDARFAGTSAGGTYVALEIDRRVAMQRHSTFQGSSLLSGEVIAGCICLKIDVAGSIPRTHTSNVLTSQIRQVPYVTSCLDEGMFHISCSKWQRLGGPVLEDRERLRI
jgi:hypothetical protein